MPSSLTQLYKVKNYKSHFFRKPWTKFFQTPDLSCPLTSSKDLVKSFSTEIFSFQDRCVISIENSLPPQGHTVFKQFSPLFLDRADFVHLQNIYICNFFIASAIKTSQYVSRRDFKFIDQDSWEKHLITLDVYTNAVKNR